MKKFLLLFLLWKVAVGAENSDFTIPYQNAVVAYKSGDYPAAKTAALEAGKRGGEDLRPSLLLGKIALAQKNYREAESLIAPLIQKNPDNPMLWMPWGDTLVFLGKPGKAINFYEKASHVDAQKPDALLRKVYAFLKNQERGEAERITAAMDGFNDKTPVYYFAKAAVLDASGKKPEADVVLKNARTLYGETVYLDYYREYLWFIGSPLK
ncbi:MAG: tetratricopeptide repeat protein [Verrucomicrobiota bacterium]